MIKSINKRKIEDIQSSVRIAVFIRCQSAVALVVVASSSSSSSSCSRSFCAVCQTYTSLFIVVPIRRPMM